MSGIIKDKCLLAICIPTYNRSSILDESLTSLIPLVKGLDIVIYVIDNGSTDNTEDIVARFNGNGIRYIKNDENIGGDLNILKSYKVASGIAEYVCVLGDSYRFKKDLHSMIQLLSSKDINLLILNREGVCFSDVTTSRYYYNSNEILQELGGGLDLVGCLLIKSEAIKQENYMPYVWSNFIHTGMVFHYLSTINNIKCYFLKEQVLYHTHIDKTSTSWYRNSLEIFGKTWMLVIMSLPGMLSIDAKLKCIKKHDHYTHLFSLKRILLLRKNKLITYRDVRQYKHYIPFVTDTSLALFYLSCFIPSFFLKISFYIWKKLKP